MTKARVNADNASADIQGVTAGTGLTGGGTSGTVTLAVDTTTISISDATTTTAARGAGYMGIPQSTAATTGSYTIVAAVE